VYKNCFRKKFKNTKDDFMITQHTTTFPSQNSQNSTSCCCCPKNKATYNLGLVQIRDGNDHQIDPNINSIALTALEKGGSGTTNDPSDPVIENKDNIIEDFPLARFMRFIKHLNLSKLLKQITDPRDPKKTKYKIEMILQWVLTVFFFRCESVNALQTAFEKLPKHRKTLLWNYFGLDEGSSLPYRTVITDALAFIDYEEINELLEKLFKWAMKSKIFYNHMEILLPDFYYYLACDGVWVHKYTHPHAKDEEGNNICPYCLPRVHNKGKENEYTDYLHAFVNLAFIFPGGVQLPIYVYPLKAEQLQGNEASSDTVHKQECEIQATQLVLPIIKQKFPKLAIKFLADSLYANEPLLLLCERLGWQYLIVRQVGSLKKVAEQCDGLEKTDLYKNSYQSIEIEKLKNGNKLERIIKWFNNVTVGKNSFTNIIRFEEIEYNPDGSIARNEQGNQKRFKTEWLSSVYIDKKNCFSLAKLGRMRADHEDLHNSLKNRGFAAKHDYARTNPNACLIWKLVMFVAFWIFEMFSFTKLAQESKGTGSWMALARELLADLTKVSWDVFKLSTSLQKENMQFRFNFSP
jgi:hypothetical protein